MVEPKAHASMNAALRAQCGRIQELLAKAAVDEVETRYEIGLIVRAVEDDEGKYGERAIQQLALEIGYSSSTLYKYAAVARLWTADEIRDLRKRPNHHGEPLSWTHWTELTRVPKKWRPWLERSLAESWSARRLGRELDLVARHSGVSEDDAEETTRAALVEAIKDAQRSSTQMAAFAAALDRLGRSTRHPPEIGELLARALDLFGNVHRRTGEIVARVRELAPPSVEGGRKRMES
jgi:hypothetical protein